MITIKTEVRPSSIHGLGLFAAERVLKGTVVWRYSPIFDVMYSDEVLSEIPNFKKEWIHKYAYRSKLTGLWCLAIDDARFFNHSKTPNTIDTGDDLNGTDIAIRDIEVGEEITIDYYSYDADADRKLRSK